jgi:hypothetical protein
LSPSVYGSLQTRLKPASEIFGVDSQVAAANTYVRDRLSLLSELRPSIAQRLSLQTDTGEGGVVESQTYTGILVLEDLVFDSKTGRASLPASAFEERFYEMALQMLPKNPYR